jgi:hypothetical protein
MVSTNFISPFLNWTSKSSVEGSITYGGGRKGNLTLNFIGGDGLAGVASHSLALLLIPH